MLPHFLTNFEIQNYYQNEPKFNSVSSRNNLPKIKVGTYAINLDECKSIGTHWIALYVNPENVTYIDNFEVEHVPKEIEKLIGIKNITTNTYKMRAYDLIMCEYFCPIFIDFMLKDQSLLDYTHLCSLNEYEKNDKTILKYFQ